MYRNTVWECASVYVHEGYKFTEMSGKMFGYDYINFQETLYQKYKDRWEKKRY